MNIVILLWLNIQQDRTSVRKHMTSANNLKMRRVALWHATAVCVNLEAMSKHSDWPIAVR
jgi:hypothetical protein